MLVVVLVFVLLLFLFIIILCWPPFPPPFHKTNNNNPNRPPKHPKWIVEHFVSKNRKHANTHIALSKSNGSSPSKPHLSDPMYPQKSYLKNRRTKHTPTSTIQDDKSENRGSNMNPQIIPKVWVHPSRPPFLAQGLPNKSPLTNFLRFGNHFYNLGNIVSIKETCWGWRLIVSSEIAIRNRVFLCFVRLFLRSDF